MNTVRCDKFAVSDSVNPRSHHEGSFTGRESRWIVVIITTRKQLKMPIPFFYFYRPERSSGFRRYSYLCVIVFNLDVFRELCPKEDDIWFKACSMVKGTPVVVTNLGINPKHHCIHGSQEEALRHFNHTQDGNRAQMQSVFEYFDIKSEDYI